jgi:hypothetical protein
MKKTTVKEIVNAIVEDIRMEDLFGGCSILRERGVIIQDPDTEEYYSVTPHMEELCQLEDLGMTEHDSIEHLMFGMVYLPLTSLNRKSVAFKVFSKFYAEAVAKGVKYPSFHAFVDTMNDALAGVMCSLTDTQAECCESVN